MGDVREVTALMQVFRVDDARPERYVARLTRDERYVLAQVAEQVIELLESEVVGLDVDEGDADVDVPEGWPLAGVTAEVPDAPSDSAVARLLPYAATTEPEVSAEFRRLTQQDVARHKVARLVDLIGRLVRAEESTSAASATAFFSEDDLGLGARDVVVGRDEAADVAGALTDLRLVLADRLEIVDEESAERLDDAVAAAWEGRPAAEHGLDERVRLLGSVYVLTGFLQDSLVELMLADLRSR